MNTHVTTLTLQPLYIDHTMCKQSLVSQTASAKWSLYGYGMSSVKGTEDVALNIFLVPHP